MGHRFETGDRVQPKHYTRDGFDRGTVTRTQGQWVLVKWDEIGPPIEELASDLDKLR